MRDEPFALSTRPPTPSADTDYDAICAAVTATARGRWFLDEFARRNRNTDTTEVLDAIARMQASLLSDRTQQTAQQANQEVRIELLEMARTIALTRAEVAERKSEAARAAVTEPTGAASPEIAAAAERLLQIAWTMRACGVELAASDQIGQVAQAILSADTLRNLDDHRAHRLTEALHHLEQRIDRMLDGHGSGTDDARVAPPPQATLPGRQAEREPTASDAAAIGAAIFAAAAAVEAETEPAAAPANDDIPLAAKAEAVPPPPVPEVLAAKPALEQEAPEDDAQAEVAEAELAEAYTSAPTDAAPDESAQAPVPEDTTAPVLEEVARAALPAQMESAAAEGFLQAEEFAEQAERPVTLEATEYPMDDDVVLSIADSVPDIEPAPLPSLELGPAVVAPSPNRPAPLPATDMAPVSFTTSAPDPAAIAVNMELEPEPVPSREVPTFRAERAELDIEPLVVADDDPEAVFSGLDLEPLVVGSEAATEAQVLATPARQESDVPAASVTIDDVLNRQPAARQPISERPLAHAPTAFIPDTDLSAHDDLLVTSTTVATTLPERLPIDAVERATQAADQPRSIPLELDPIAVQVDDDLDSLADIVPNDFAPGIATHVHVNAPAGSTVQTAAAIEDDPADFLLEALPAPVSTARDFAPPPAPAADMRQPPTAEFTTTLAAIETELTLGAIGADSETKAAAIVTTSQVAATTITSASSAADSTLAALMAMSEEERIALFS